MTKRNRIFLGIVALFVVAVGLLLYRVANDLDSRYRESAEESLVDTAHILSAFIETDMDNGRIQQTLLRAALDNAYRRRFEARIFAITKRQVDLHVYLTDASGTVLFDSEGKAEGQDFHRWRDVALALSGEYGARTTLRDPSQLQSAVMYVAAPIRDGEEIVGAVSVGKPVASLHELVVTARRKLLYVGVITLVAFFSLLVMLSVWLARPFGFTSDLVRVFRQEGLRRPGRLLRRLASVLHAAYNDMRDALAGRSYTEEYVQTLTHELKSPLTAIRGAAELLREPMPDAQRERFVGNIGEQVQRLQLLADRMLELAALEKRRTLDDILPVSLQAVVHDAMAAMEPAAARRRVRIEAAIGEDVVVEGDSFLLMQATINLLANAIDFSPPDATVELAVTTSDRKVEISVRDHGPGVPDYALDRIFEKFYSLHRPDTGKKGTGLGLAFVREIAHLHGGEARLGNHVEGGAVASMILPLPASRR